MKKLISIFLAVALSTSYTGCGTNNNETSTKEIETSAPETTILKNTVDYSREFGKIKGCSIFYNPAENTYDLYNEKECETRYSPNSTFKIIATLEGLECGAVTSPESLMNYNGNTYPFESWNRNLNLKEAFQNSCVWYYRQLIDKIGKERIKSVVTELGYGNCDVSSWEGSGLAPTEDTNGFWLGSSLEISPMEMVRVVSDIFEGKSKYRPEHISMLKDFMASDIEGVYGKTGTGGVDNSAWYAGFYEKEDSRIYFAVHLQNDDGDKIAGADAKEIASKIIENHYK